MVFKGSLFLVFLGFYLLAFVMFPLYGMLKEFILDQTNVSISELPEGLLKQNMNLPVFSFSNFSCWRYCYVPVAFTLQSMRMRRTSLRSPFHSGTQFQRFAAFLSKPKWQFQRNPFRENESLKEYLTLRYHDT